MPFRDGVACGAIALGLAGIVCLVFAGLSALLGFDQAGTAWFGAFLLGICLGISGAGILSVATGDSDVAVNAMALLAFLAGVGLIIAALFLGGMFQFFYDLWPKGGPV